MAKSKKVPPAKRNRGNVVKREKIIKNNEDILNRLKSR